MSTLKNQIRNIQQSVQYRDVTKQAPDIDVFIDGQNTLINPYLGAQGVPVSFNDYVASFSASYDVDSLIPTGSITLAVPVHLDYLFRIPGGNNILKTMSGIKVFAKGAYLSPRGNSVYWQVFNGIITSVNYAQSGKFTNISISFSGALMLLERMQIDTAPTVMSSSPMEVTPFSSTAWNLNPYQMLAYVFLYSSMIDGFSVNSIQQAKMDATNPYFQAVDASYVAKWQAMLYAIAQDTHIFGVPDVSDVLAQIAANVKKPDGSGTPYNKEAMGTARDKIGVLSESDSHAANSSFFEQIKEYMPDMSFGNIQLINGRTISRLERLRYLTSLIGFEAYQDIDGSIVIKPPIYNLDVTVVGTKNSSQTETSAVDFYDNNNPFIAELSEILPGESETEDEAGVRLTRLTGRGSLNPGFQMHGTEPFLAVSEDIDIPKLAQFGLRSEEPINVSWFRDSDTKAIYGYVASELARANRGFRTYSFTIPMRPELKLGFPMYIPHKDIYGYIKNVSINYSQGSGAATMSIVLDSIRRRPMFPVEQTVPQPDGTNITTTILTAQPDLVLRWTTPGAPPVSASTSGGSGLNTPQPQGTQSAAQLNNTIASLPLPQQIVVDQEIQMLHYRQNKIGNSYGPQSDMTNHNWRVQPDTQHLFDSKGQYSKPRILGPEYYEDLRSTRPYTDDKGYELVGPFPWGRWKTLRQAVYDFTIADAQAPANQGGVTTGLNPAIQPGSVPSSSSIQTLSNAQAFLFTGNDTPATTDDAATQVVDNMVNQARTIGNTKVFELTYTSTDPTNDIGGTQSISDPGAETDTAVDENEDTIATRAATFLTGKVQPSNTALAVLKSITPTNVSTGVETSNGSS
jgi:hypothetical protein